MLDSAQTQVQAYFVIKDVDLQMTTAFKIPTED